MKSQLLARLSIATILFSPGVIRAQANAQPRYPLQTYYGDSLHVFWTQYPNPFSPSSIKEGDPQRAKTQICGDLSFYSDLSDRPVVVLLNERDSAVYSFEANTKSAPNFNICYWLATPLLSKDQLPVLFLRSDSTYLYKFKILLKVAGRNEAVRAFDLYFPKAWYAWFVSF